MKNYEEIKYKKNFLKPVLVRLDFHQFIPNERVFTPQIEETILKFFPFKGIDQQVRFGSVKVKVDAINPDATDATSKSLDGIRKEFYSMDRINKAALSNKYLIFEINNYVSFDEHQKAYDAIIDALFRNNVVNVNRTGIRYVNMFEVETIKVHKGFFNNDIAAMLIKKLDENAAGINLVRAMNLSEYRVGTAVLNFRYGMFNPEYPRVLKKNSFVLDYDCYTEEIKNEAGSIMQFLEAGHNQIQFLFETSITDALRRVMNDE